MALENSSENNVLPLVERAQSRQLPVETANQTILFISFWVKVLNARLLAVIALVGALFIWGFTIWAPTPDRIEACAFFTLVLWPVIFLYLKKGD